LLLVAFLLVNAPNCHLSLVLASVVQGDAVHCNIWPLVKSNADYCVDILKARWLRAESYRLFRVNQAKEFVAVRVW